MILVPAFSGPPTTLGKNLSKFDQLSLTLLLHKEGKQIENVSILDTYVNKAIPIAIKTQRSSLGHNLCGRNMSYNCSENKQNNTTTDSTPFTLFGGSLAVPQFVENPNRSHSSNVNDKGNRIVTDTVQPKDIVHEHVSAKANENSLRNSQLGVSTSQSSASNSSKPKTNKFSMLGKLLQKSSTDLKSNHNGDGSVELPVASKRKKLSDAASIEQPTKRRTVPSISNVMSSVQTRISMSDFAGIEGFCRNAGASPKGLQSLLQKLSKTESVVLSVVWSSLITNHATTTTKFCTPSVPCTKWNCSCDRNIRAKHAVSEILGLLVLLPAELNHIYFLPLVPCIHASTGSLEIVDSVKSIMNLPLTCNTSLMDRWNAVRDLLSMDQGQNSSECSKIIYNGQLALMPIINALEAKSESRQSLNAEYNDLFDPRVAAYLCETDINEKQLELDALFMKYDVDLPPLNANNCGKISAVLAEAKIEMIGLLQVYQKLKVALIASKTLSLFATVEMPIVVILSRMECRGISISESRLVAIRNSIAVKIDEKESEAKVLVGKSFNLASPEQVSNILYEDLKLPPPQTSHNSNKKASKHLSTAEEDLLRIKALHPIVEVILSYRSLAKLQSTYVNNYQQFINHENMSLASNVSPSDVDFPGWEKENCGKVHACWTQTNVRTGRLSCCKPNLQNLPNRQTIAGLDVDLRSVFLPSFGFEFVTADYSQIEMRILAHLCGDIEMIQLFRAEGDIYRKLAGLIFSKDPSAVSDSERSQSKVICLGVLYGMGVHSMANKLGIEVSAASSISNSFFDNFKQMKQWIISVKSHTKVEECVRTLLGRVRYLPEINSTDSIKSAMAERQAVNSIIQGTASDIMKYAMILIEKKINLVWKTITLLDVQGRPIDKPVLLMQIHDELIYEVPKVSIAKHSALTVYSLGVKNDANEFAAKHFANDAHNEVPLSSVIHEIIRFVMEKEVENNLKLSVPLIVNIHHGNDMGQLK